MLIHLVTNSFSSPMLNASYCMALGMLWMLWIVWAGVEYAPGRIQLATQNYTFSGPVRCVVYRAARWHLRDTGEQIEYHAWLWLNSRVIGA